ncbi:GcrA cell cycle regulator [Komagataeibacter medellinensis]|uniref:GcrA cell cycle regulator n=1 Tax=Komagataeibacter medellinensis TaxID=1177712 RepID=A0ABQ6VW12_9PROT|nr:GcrA family cell cycle regulator [Komagataeibacter medellinensis]KAB8124365.1 GcrA cell cycle regulator [Komagataeibacter medellinensis]
MAMEWTEETIARLRDLWQQGLSTAEIGRQLSVTKNAVVGKAHRLGLKPRPSPIRRAAKPVTAAPAAESAAAMASAQAAPSSPAPAEVEAAPAAAAVPPPVPQAAPVAPVEAPRPKVEVTAPTPAATAQEPAVEPRAPRPSARATRAAAAALRPVSEPRRRSSQSCCWPLGDPGTPGFHFCGATPLPGKPYCAEHAQLAYVKLRDRRDNVA